MDVFELRNDIIEEYERFSRSFTEIKAPDILSKIDEAYKEEKFWPEPLIQINPHFESGGTLAELVAEGLLDPECERIFRIKHSNEDTGKELGLHRHQTDAIRLARKEKSYVLTTGTGSGKSLAYFIPIVDDVLRRKKQGTNHNGIGAIVVYPMNALCNSQYQELKKYLCHGYEEGEEPVTFARYTGQEGSEERERIARNPPDILLTNYVMLELLMTRFVDTDQAVRKHARGLRYLVLDELHTYRGRQGADVAMLVRRTRDRFNQRLICIGTSATMASEGSSQERNQTVCDVATKLFGARVEPDQVITETLNPVTRRVDDPSALERAILEGVPEDASYDDLLKNPIAGWIEHNLGLKKEADGRFIRIPRPLSITAAANELAKKSGVDKSICRDYLSKFLLESYKTRNEDGRNLFAFRLHQFISGAWNAYSTLEPEGERHITTEGQKFAPGDGKRERLLFPLCFCRECGQEYFPVRTRMENKRPTEINPRELSDYSEEDEEDTWGYLMPDSEGRFDPAYPERHYPDEWLETFRERIRVKPSHRKYEPIRIQVDTFGNPSPDGLPAWFIQKKFRFCLNPECETHYRLRKGELSKLSALSSEGRSSATTVLTLSSLKRLIDSEDLDEETKKLLAFTDNRQDASLQAGHFNDFIQILLLRSALLAAIESSEDQVLTDEILAQRVFDHLGLEPQDYASNPDTKGFQADNTVKALRDVLGYRLYFDLKRGWRITNPNLEQLHLLKIGYRDLMECCQDESEWGERHRLLANLPPEKRHEIIEALLNRMRGELCIKTIYLDPIHQEQIRNRSHNSLLESWGLLEGENLISSKIMVPRPKQSNKKNQENLFHISSRSRFGNWLKKKERWGGLQETFGEETYNKVIDDILEVLTTYGYVEPSTIDNDRKGYRIDSSVLEWRSHLESQAEAQAEARTESEKTSSDRTKKANRFFHDLYTNVKELLANKEEHFFHRLEAREHTAQVSSDDREVREERFRQGMKEKSGARKSETVKGLPVLFCSPTMELGVDISTLNMVYMRNVPPTPANYAQRSGRAGRSGQPALIITYCAARSPHDQYFFSDPTRMAAGVVNPPTIDLANEDLLRSHLHALWLAESNKKLENSVCQVLDLQKDDAPPLDDIREEIDTHRVKEKALERARRIVDGMKAYPESFSANWCTDSWIENAISSAYHRFDESFKRWRSLYRATAKQMRFNQDILNNPAATERERKDASNRHEDALRQQNLLLAKKSSLNSDFYTYRYLAAQGFLPGYNFPRLPLMAFIPGQMERGSDKNGSYLTRPRFLGLFEFGPQSIIYHEGNTYRVRRAIISPSDDSQTTTSARLGTKTARLCPRCGYRHSDDQSEHERCVSCDASLADGVSIINLHPIDQVSTRRAFRITSDEEERQRQGYEMITTFCFDKRSDQKPITRIHEKGELLLGLKYGHAATLWRINLGWRRRENKSIHGFAMDPATGEWAGNKDSDQGIENSDDTTKENKYSQRITPFVEDTRNALIIHTPSEDSNALDTTMMSSLQYALKRGIEQEFQLEEQELAVEALPDRNNHRTILFYEASEGGAGVLTRLVKERGALRKVARKALEICHYEPASGDWRGDETADNLKDNLEEECEAGCYRCLLSYANQQDHKTIDRKNPEMIDLLCRLTRCDDSGANDRASDADSLQEMRNISISGLEHAWLDFIKARGYHLPDKAQHYLEAHRTRPDFSYTASQVLVYIDGPHHDKQRQRQKDTDITRRLEAVGYTIVRFPADKAAWPGILDEYAWVFGQGNDEKEER